jgi:hypothetical protein
VTQPMTQSDGLTVWDAHGGSLVVERWEAGTVAVWVADGDRRESRSVTLSENDRRRIARFLLDGLQ